MTPQELLQTAFAQDVAAIRTKAEQLLAVYLKQDVTEVFPFSGAVANAALASTSQGVSQINQELALGVQNLQAAVNALSAPVIAYKGGNLEPQPEPIIG